MSRSLRWLDEPIHSNNQPEVQRTIPPRNDLHSISPHFRRQPCRLQRKQQVIGRCHRVQKVPLVRVGARGAPRHTQGLPHSQRPPPVTSDCTYVTWAQTWRSGFLFDSLNCFWKQEKQKKKQKHRKFIGSKIVFNDYSQNSKPKFANSYIYAKWLSHGIILYLLPRFRIENRSETIFSNGPLDTAGG